ncbi:MAG: hypothetical protein BWZ08_01952 [candidate division BRC1 bacterium ADurb.BinA292]|nr:MAG: hypothetical protein BWZ08_01952 [candidate division BRC1 bacterium ADurb.BinA292]
MFQRQQLPHLRRFARVAGRLQQLGLFALRLCVGGIQLLELAQDAQRAAVLAALVAIRGENLAQHAARFLGPALLLQEFREPLLQRQVARFQLQNPQDLGFHRRRLARGLHRVEQPVVVPHGHHHAARVVAQVGQTAQDLDVAGEVLQDAQVARHRRLFLPRLGEFLGQPAPFLHRLARLPRLHQQNGQRVARFGRLPADAHQLACALNRLLEIPFLFVQRDQAGQARPALGRVARRQLCLGQHPQQRAVARLQFEALAQQRRRPLIVVARAGVLGQLAQVLDRQVVVRQCAVGIHAQPAQHQAVRISPQPLGRRLARDHPLARLQRVARQRFPRRLDPLVVRLQREQPDHPLPPVPVGPEAGQRFVQQGRQPFRGLLAAALDQRQPLLGRLAPLTRFVQQGARQPQPELQVFLIQVPQLVQHADRAGPLARLLIQLQDMLIRRLRLAISPRSLIQPRQTLAVADIARFDLLNPAIKTLRALQIVDRQRPVAQLLQFLARPGCVPLLQPALHQQLAGLDALWH